MMELRSFPVLFRLFFLLLLLLPNEAASRRRPIPLAAVGAYKPPKKSQAAQAISSSPSVVQRLATGGASRCVAQAVLYPIDALRTLAQTRDGRTLADVGANALVRGCLTTSSFALLMGAIQFSIFGVMKDRIGSVGAAALGAAGSCLVSVPQEVIKQRLVTGVYSGFRDAVATIYNSEGIRGFYSSWRPTMARNVPFVIVTFTTMDFLKSRISKNRGGNKELTLAENAFVGMGSALVAGIITNPVDFVKTRMMTQAASNAIPYSSALDCVRTVVKTEGLTAFYAGFKQRSVYMCLLWGITFALNGHFNKAVEEKETTITSR